MLITPEDLDRLSRLEIEREGDHDVVWACRLARKLAWLKPTEAQFSQYVALINQIACSAFPVRHDETLFLRGAVGVKDPKFSHQVVCSQKEAILFVRPYVILETPKFPEIISTLEKFGRFMVKVDGKELAQGWLAEILVGLDGYGVRRKPYTFMPPKQPIDNVFSVGILQPVNDPFGYSGQSALPADLGVMLADGAKMEVALDLPEQNPEDPPVGLSIGLVAARYTTRATGAVVEGVPILPISQG